MLSVSRSIIRFRKGCKLPSLPKPPLLGEVATRSVDGEVGQSNRFVCGRCFGLRNRQILQKGKLFLPSNLSVCFADSSPSRGASGEEAKLSGLPRPPLLGEVASRRDDGEVGWKDSFSLYDAVCGFVSQSICLKVSFCFVQPLSLALLDSSPSRGAIGKP